MAEKKGPSPGNPKPDQFNTPPLHGQPPGNQGKEQPGASRTQPKTNRGMPSKSQGQQGTGLEPKEHSHEPTKGPTEASKADQDSRDNPPEQQTSPTEPSQAQQHEADLEYQALQSIQTIQAQKADQLRQRDLAAVLGISLGMTNSIIKRLVHKGWLVMHKVNGRNLAYSLTPEGTREVAKRSYRYLRRTIGSVVRWKQTIDNLALDAKHRGRRSITLVGPSDLDFIVEHTAGRHGLGFRHISEGDFNARPSRTPSSSELVLFGEGVAAPERMKSTAQHVAGGQAGPYYLQVLLVEDQ